jgi:hypothetical protein
MLHPRFKRGWIMKSTCIQHPTNEPLLVIRQWQLDFCEGNHCAAALLSFFEYWHNLRLEISQRAKPANRNAQQHGKPATQDESLLQFHSDEQLQAGLLNLYGTMKIRESRRLLITKGALTEHSNPKPRYAFDRTVYYHFHPEAVNAWLKQLHKSDSKNINVTCAENGGRVAENGGRVAENGDCSPETTTEVTTEITTTTPNPSSSNRRSAEPEPARGGGAQDEKTKVQDTHHGIATLEPNEKKTVSQREAPPDPTTGTDYNTATENPKTVSQEEDHDGQWPELVYPAKLTEAEYADITVQVDPLPPEIAQQMLDVVESRMQSGQIRTNPAALLRGVIRKYQADPDAFDPSSGFHIADQRRRRAEAEARLRAAEARRPYETATGIPHRRSEEQRQNARKFVDEALSILRG